MRRTNTDKLGVRFDVLTPVTMKSTVLWVVTPYSREREMSSARLAAYFFWCLPWLFFCGVGLKPPLGPFSRSPRFRFLRSLCSSPLGPYKSQHCGHIGLLCIPRKIHEGDCGVIGGENDDCRGNRRTRRKPAPAPLCLTTNPTWPGSVSNPGPQRWEASD
jgi:hypothetical protein